MIFYLRKHAYMPAVNVTSAVATDIYPRILSFRVYKVQKNGAHFYEAYLFVFAYKFAAFTLT